MARPKKKMQKRAKRAKEKKKRQQPKQTVSGTLARAACRVARTYHRQRYWETVPGDGALFLELPDEEDMLLASVLGHESGTYGLLLARGPESVRRMLALEGTGADEGLMHASEILAVSFLPWSTLESEERAFLRAGGFRHHRESAAPTFESKAPHATMRLASPREIQTLTWAMAAIVAADDAGDLDVPSRGLGQNWALVLRAEGALDAPNVEARTCRLHDVTPERPSGTFRLPPLLKQLPEVPESWIVATTTLPISPTKTARAVIVAGERGADSEVLEGSGESAFSEFLTRLMSKPARGGRPGLPASITFGDAELHDIAGEALRELGVHTRVDPDDPRLADLKQHMDDSLHDQLRASAAPAALADGEDDIRFWKEASAALISWMGTELDRLDALTPRAWSRYFGSRDRGKDILTEQRHLSPLPALLDWVFADYRSTRRSRTFIETLLARRDLGDVERELLEAQRNAYLSVFRVLSRDPGASLDVEDLRTGERTTVHDFALSGSKIDGWVLPLRLMPIRSWTFSGLAGPPMHAMQAARWLDELDPEGELTGPTGLREVSNELGSVWDILDDPLLGATLLDSEGSEIVFHTAHALTDDPDAFVKALTDHPCVERDGNTWIWCETMSTATPFEEVVIATFEMHENHILVDTSSAQRHARVASWLETVPGTRIVRVTTKSADPNHERELDDRLPQASSAEEDNPEVRAAIEEFMRDHYATWPDSALPALDGLTPREACRSPSGRRRVERMIRTLADVTTPGGTVAAPREALLRELGFTSTS